jgi:hypothetical protein
MGHAVGWLGLRGSHANVACSAWGARAAAEPRVRPRAAQDLFVLDGIPQNVSSFSFFFTGPSCGVVQPNMTFSSLRRQWYADPAAPKRITLQAYHNVCSWDQLTFRPVRRLPRPHRAITLRGVYERKKDLRPLPGVR